jgi:hypothetical protein
MKVVLLVAIFALSFLENSCFPEKPDPFPLLAEFDHGKIDVPMFQAMPGYPPGSIVFYPVFMSDKKIDSDPFPLKGTFVESRTDIAVGDFSDTREFLMRKGLIYSSEKEKCMKSADHYLYAGYDTVPDSDENFERANCRQALHPEDLRIW